MNYYEKHISDYRRDTTHLSLLEHGVYNQLLDTYYLSEMPLTSDLESLMRTHCARTADERKAFVNVLKDFFTLSSDGYIHDKCECVLEDIRKKLGQHWARNLPAAHRASLQAARAARIRSASPRWLTRQHMTEIKAVYEESARLSASTGVRHEVDHIVPLSGEAVCGLHVPWNLQPIPAEENRLKSNYHGA